MPPHPLTIPTTLDPVHAALLREHHFETAGTVRHCQGSDAYDGVRVVYAITNPTQTAIVYVGDSEEGRNLRGRLKCHLDSRGKAGVVERDSMVFVHVLITEYMVLCRFWGETGKMPELNKRLAAKHTRTKYPARVNPMLGKRGLCADHRDDFSRRVDPDDPNPQISHGIIRVVT